ncbi:hypothetical protein V6Z11_A12G046900 [Gossypium hirsutum]
MASGTRGRRVAAGTAQERICEENSQILCEALQLLRRPTSL